MRLASDTLRLRASALADSPSRPIAPRHSQQSAAPPARVLDRWQLLRQQFASEHAALYEARPMTQPSDAPTDYLVKVARQADSAGIAVALLRRERAVADSVFHPHL
ncbi:MAG TPA: hypothetical protein VFB96_23945, partial [Pirellulaceae bacterium]|nr:hypothetical protein [Pirellulaceae bacterium]